MAPPDARHAERHGAESDLHAGRRTTTVRDSFTFTVNDGRLDSAAATVSITVTPVNDAPVAHGAEVTTAEDTAVAIDARPARDPDGDALTFAVVTTPAHGTLSGTAPT